MSSDQKRALTIGQQIVAEHNAKLDSRQQQESSRGAYRGFNNIGEISGTGAIMPSF